MNSTTSPEIEARKTSLRHQIMNVIKAHDLAINADTWFSLVFMDEKTLKSFARRLKISKK